MENRRFTLVFHNPYTFCLLDIVKLILTKRDEHTSEGAGYLRMAIYWDTFESSSSHLTMP